MLGSGAGASTPTCMYIAGSTPPYSALVETFDGSSWTEVGDLNDSRQQGSAGGNQTAAWYCGGYGGSPGTNSNQTETWNGSAWTEVNEMNTGRAYLTGGGEATAGLIYGGGPISPGYTNKTEYWNGTSWTEMNDMATVSETSFGVSIGTSVAAYRASGRVGPSVTTATEEWNVDNALSTVTVS